MKIHACRGNKIRDLFTGNKAMMVMMTITYEHLIHKQEKTRIYRCNNFIGIIVKKTVTDNLLPLNGKFQIYIHYGVGHTVVLLCEDAKTKHQFTTYKGPT